LQSEHSKKYDSDIEEKFRLKVFMDNKQRVAKHNAKFNQGHVSFKLKINKFADLVRITSFFFSSFIIIGKTLILNTLEMCYKCEPFRHKTGW
jgi:hypothetical protein